MKKRERSARRIAEQDGLFCCPVSGCNQGMHVQDLLQLICFSGHSFDIARQGYVNLTTRPIHSAYEETLFVTRRQVIRGGAYDPLHRQLAEEIRDSFSVEKTLHLLDAGCGEGSHLASVQELLQKEGLDITGVGIDLAKPGVLMGARDYPESIWCVGDLARAPFCDASFQVILNLLSPASYEEFNRILRPGGVLLKVVPRADYLEEIRNFYEGDARTGMYSNEESVALFGKHFPKAKVKPLQWQVPADRERLAQIAEMTPLSWHRTPDQKQALLDAGIRQITFSFDLLVGQKGMSR